MTRFIIATEPAGSLLIDTDTRTAAVVARFLLPPDEGHKAQAVADLLNRGDLAAYDDLEPF